MERQTYVFDAELVGCEGVRRAVALRDDLTLVDLHYALQSAFGWDDDHLFAFWLRAGFWSSPRVSDACARLAELDLSAGGRLSYVFDFERERRVALTLRERRPYAGGPSSRLLEAVGAAPPQYARAAA